MSRWSLRSMGLGQVVVLILVVVLASATLSSTFATMPRSELEMDGEDPVDLEPDMILNDWPSEFSEVFKIHQFGSQAYLRCEVMLEYEDGRWYWVDEDDFEEYPTGQWMGPTPFIYESADIIPFDNWYGALPIAKNTMYLALGSGTSMGWNSSLEVMRPGEVIDVSYNIKYLGYPISSLEELRGATVTEVPDYLQVPDGIFDEIKGLAETISAGQDTPYDKAMAIRGHLRSNYNYTFNFTRAPEGYDPVEWFLFHSKEGVCSHFNSAFALLARSIGIPTRIVSGYLINPSLEMQTVFAKQAHAYAEILLDGIGWTVMDGTPLAPSDRYEDPSSENMDITGTVFIDANGNGVFDISGQYVVPEQALEGVMVRIFGPNDIRSTLYSDENGEFYYRAPSTGNYTVSVVQEEGWSATTWESYVYNIGVDAPSPSYFGFVWANRTVGDRTGFTIEMIEILGGTIKEKSEDWSLKFVLRDENGSARLSSHVYAYLEMADGSRLLIGKQGAQSTSSIPDNISWFLCTVPNWIDPGNYTVVVRWIGNVTYAPVEDNGTVTIIGAVRISMSVSSYLLPYESSQVQLHTFDADSGTELSGMAVSCTLANGSVANRITTPGVGTIIPFATEGTGRFTIASHFNGSYLYMPSDASVSYTVTNPRLVVSTPNLVRGESNILYGKLVLGSLPMPGTMVDLRIDPILNESMITDEQGMINIDVDVGKDIEIGEYNVSYSTDRVQGNASISVVAKTIMVVVQSDRYVNVNLTDDAGLPIPDARIVLYYSDITSIVMTGEDGTVNVLIESSEPVRCYAIFEGNLSYIGSRGDATFIPPMDPLQWLWVPALASAIVIALIVIVTRDRRPDGRPTIVEKKERERSEGVMAKGPHEVLFPDIHHGMPWVWSSGPVRMRVLTPDDEITMISGGERHALNVVDGTAETTIDLTVGRHVITLEGASGRTVIAVRVVEYRQEIIDLYDRALKNWMPEMAVGPDMSPREVFDVAEGRGARSNAAEALTKIEIAAYSDHPVERSDYELVFDTLFGMGGLA